MNKVISDCVRAAISVFRYPISGEINIIISAATIFCCQQCQPGQPAVNAAKRNFTGYMVCMLCPVLSTLVGLLSLAPHDYLGSFAVPVSPVSAARVTSNIPDKYRRFHRAAQDRDLASEHIVSAGQTVAMFYSCFIHVSL